MGSGVISPWHIAIFVLVAPEAGFENEREGTDSSIRTLSRELFSDLNKNAKAVDRARELILDDWSIGARSMRSAPFDVFPEFAPPYIEIQTEAPGLSTTEVESLVTMPLENVLYGMPGLKTLMLESTWWHTPAPGVAIPPVDSHQDGNAVLRVFP